MSDVRAMIRDGEVFWTDSIDFDNNQCRTLIHRNGLTSRLARIPFGRESSTPIHQTCELRKNGVRLV